jgi:uncharacterized protein with PIN domain/tRNA(Ser,Leu) C12 N-acetylase TAN1
VATKTYLIRCAETGREQQARLGKLRRDLEAVIRAHQPDARIETAPGRVFVTAEGDIDEVLAALPGVATVSPCVRVAFAELERVVLDLVSSRLESTNTFAVRVRRGGGRSGASADESTPAIARRLANGIAHRTGARTDLESPDLSIGVELRGDEAFVFDTIIDGVDRAGPTTPPAHGEPRFVVDQMLGRLAARLRLLGYDAITVFDIADSEVTRLAVADGRILLTRDHLLSQTRAVHVHYVVARDTREQLIEVVRALGLSPDVSKCFTRCTLCNAMLARVDETTVADRVPPGVRDRGISFVQCTSCSQVYWRGSHVDRILAELSSVVAA